MIKATIIALILMAGQASAQGITRLVWRIHHVDTIKNEIEITQTGQRFDNASEIENPKKEIYKMHFDSLGFSINLRGGLPNSKYKLRLSPSKFQDLKAMKVIKLKMEERGLKAKDLEAIIGSKGHVSLILSGKREVTLKMARALRIFLGIPPEVFLPKAI